MRHAAAFPHVPPKTLPGRLRGRLAALLLLLAVFATAWAQTTTTSDSGYRIAGQVVNAGSGAPLAGAEVAIVPVVDGAWGAPSDAGPRRGRRGGRRGPAPIALQTTTTADDGTFAFERVPAGKYSLQGSRRGFITASYQEHGMYSTAVVTGKGLLSEGLSLRLSPGAVIDGSVLDAAGDPPEQANVSLYRLNDDGLGSIRMYRSTNADDLGAYEFAHLPPGTYFVSAAASVWYAQAARQSSDATAVSPSAANLDVVYPRSFYADATDSSAAAPVPVRGGEHLRIDLHLQAVPAVHLTYTVPSPTGADANLHTWARPPTVAQSVFGVTDPAYASSTVSTHRSKDGEQTLSISVAPGEYEVEVAGRTLSVNASGDALLDPQTGSLAVEISGRIAAASGFTLPEAADITLEPTGGGPSFSAVAHAGAFHFDQVRTGSYEVAAQAGSTPIAFVQIAASGARVDGHVLQVGSQPVTLAAIVAPASMIVSGFAHARAAGSEASASDQTASGVMVVLVPQHLGDHALYRRDQSDSDGSFSLRQVAPGNYTLLAICDGWELEWARPEVIEHYLPGGRLVTVTGTDGGTMHLDKPISVQDR